MIHALQADAQHLRKLAASQTDRHASKRLRVVADVANGMSAFGAAVRHGSDAETVRRWIRAFQKGGAAALSVPRDNGRPSLRPDQVSEIAHLAASASAMNLERLCEIVRERFGLSYTPGGLQNLLRETAALTARRRR